MARKIEISNLEDMVSDIEDISSHIHTLSKEDNKWLRRVSIRQYLKINRAKSIADSKKDKAVKSNSDKIAIEYVRDENFTNDIKTILQWLAELKFRDPVLYRKLPRINFEQAVTHSLNWHSNKSRKADREERAIEPNYENAPKVIDLKDGWEVFWLKTNEARDHEGAVMGHCIGDGFYDDVRVGEGVFSLRKENVPHVTFHLLRDSVMEEKSKGNSPVPQRYRSLVDKAIKILCINLTYCRDLGDTSQLHDGWHARADGMRVHIKDGLIHRDFAPAIMLRNEHEEWWQQGMKHRKGGPAVTRKNGTKEWYQDNKLHREDGPAIITPKGNQEWWINGEPHITNDGPALIKADGSEHWDKHGEPHITDDDK